MLKALVFVLAAVVVSGCYTHTSIKPTELPKLNGASVVGLGRQGNTNVYAVSVAHVEAPDGRLEEITGEFDAVITERQRGRVDFDHPVQSQIEGNALSVRGGNRAETEFNLNDVTEAEVVQLNGWTAVWAGLGGAALGGIIGLIMISSI